LRKERKSNPKIQLKKLITDDYRHIIFTCRVEIYKYGFIQNPINIHNA